MFKTIAHNAKEALTKSNEYIDIPEMLNEVIPFEYFGTKKNKRLFHRIVSRILLRSTNECIYLKMLYDNFEFWRIPWLIEFREDDVKCRKYLLEVFHCQIIFL